MKKYKLSLKLALPVILIMSTLLIATTASEIGLSTEPLGALPDGEPLGVIPAIMKEPLGDIPAIMKEPLGTIPDLVYIGGY